MRKLPFHAGLILLSASFLSVFLLHVAIGERVFLSPDGWAYWEGSIAILNGEGYTYLGGQPITTFPPLYSLFLAGIQSIVGVSGWALIVSLLITCMANVLVWGTMSQ